MKRKTSSFYSMAVAAVLSYSTLALVVPSCSWLLTRSPIVKDGKSSLSMFTGIVEEIGTVVNIEEQAMVLQDGSSSTGTAFTVQSNLGVVMEDAYLGCGICVNGLSLTTTSLDTTRNQFTVALASETIDQTCFRSVHRGQIVNLERPAKSDERNSGHFVRGHIDGTATIVDKQIHGDTLQITVQVDDAHIDKILRYVVPNGHIAVDGASSTIVHVNISNRTLTFIKEQYLKNKLAIPQKSVGEEVNLEVDVLGKCSESAMESLLPRLEALEAKVTFLENRLPQPAGESESTTRRASKKRNTMIKEGTPNFGRFIQEGTPGYTNPNLSMKPKNGDDDGGIKWVTIQGSF